MKGIGKAIMVIGIGMFVVMSVCIAEDNGIKIMGYPYPGLPVGVGGSVKFLGGASAPDGIMVTAKNINTGKEVHGITENGWYAIGIEARDGDKIVVSSEYDNMTARNSTIVNVYRTTQWCNLTFGAIAQEKASPWWLLLIPLGITAFGGYVNSYDRKHKGVRLKWK